MKSMTGYGKGRHADGRVEYNVEVRSVNHRFLDIQLRAGRPFLPIEARIVRAAKKRVRRGRIEIHIKQKWIDGDSGGGAFRVDEAMARSCYDGLEKLRQACGIREEVGLRALTEFKEIFVGQEPEEDPESVWTALSPAVEAALEELIDMRAVEGGALQKDLSERLERMSGWVADIERLSAEVPAEIKARLVERVAQTFSEVSLDPDRVAQEAVFLAERADVSEEVVRLKSHQARFAEFLEAKREIGKKLDFLLQEMNREINTVASKIGNADISQIAVEVKGEIEKMREQVQNVE